jgi:hypothetical protein
MWRRVDLVWTDVWEERIASTLKMEAIRSSETSVYTRSTLRHIPQNAILQLFFSFPYTWAGYQPVAKSHILDNQGFLPLDRLLTMAESGPRKPRKRPLPGGNQRVSGTWSSLKAESPLPAVGLSLVRVPTCYIYTLVSVTKDGVRICNWIYWPLTGHNYNEL